MRHLVETTTGKAYDMDENNMLWTCMCDKETTVGICISICKHLKAEGDLREIKRQIAVKRKELGLMEEHK